MFYLKQPKEIYKNSFAIIKHEADLSRFNEQEQEIAIRLIHSSGMVDIVDDLVFFGDAVARGREALNKNAPIICDVKMAAKGIIKRKFTTKNEILCALDNDGVNEFALENKITRSAAGIEMLKHRIDGAIIAIGNAPTSLFHLLELMKNDNIRPALILGFAVGFVGAVESKQALIEQNFGVPFITLKGRRGGSAFAAAAINALAFGLST